MITKAELDHYQKAELPYLDTVSLVDIRNVSIDRSLPLEHRMDRFISQVHNPYLFKVGDVAVKVEYAGTKPLPEALIDVFSSG